MLCNLMRPLLLVLLLLTPAFAFATGARIDVGAVRIDQNAAERIGQRLEHNTPTGDKLNQLINKVSAYKSRASVCIETQQGEVNNISQQIKTLGSPVKGESWQVTTTRLQLGKRQTKILQLAANCRLLKVTASNVLRDLLRIQNRQLTGKLLARGAPIGRVIVQLASELPHPNSLFNPRILIERLGAHDWNAILWLTSLILLGLIGGFIGRHRMAGSDPIDPDKNFAYAVFQAIGLSLNHYRPGLLISGLWSLYWLDIGPLPTGWPLLADISFILFSYYLALAAIRASFDPSPPAMLYLPFPEPLARSFGRALHWLTLNALAGALVFVTPVAKAFSTPVMLMAHSLWSALLVLNLIWIVWLTLRLRRKQGVGLIRPIIVLALLASLTAEWIGYRNLSEFIIDGVAFTLLSLLLAWLASALGNDLIDSLDEGRYTWEKRLKAYLGVSKDEFIPGLFWLRVLIYVSIWIVLIFALLRVWGLPVSLETELMHWLTRGFTIGHIMIEPGRLLFALMVFSLLLSFGTKVRTMLARRLSRSRMERGAREAAVTITGYGIMIAAALIALSITGIALQNIAIIAGALSVGIGFGLQNIVNNFVSGLILLFERPIRTGDWIVVGDVEGYVRRISIRSTQIQTFDFADVIVPNSDLISGAVTNWMLRDNYGRVRVPVGVAYGSDTRQVEEILLRIASEHPLIIHGSSDTLNPRVLFLSFGDSALNFELRAFLRSVAERPYVLSDLNFAIDAAFREADIQIPFPQRDLHILTPPPAREAPG